MVKIDNKIKLVIWDLDETLWKGVLSEEDIQIIPENIDIIKQLTNRGIVNSIASKNTYEVVKDKLEEIGLWEYFIFPQISWNPKGQVIKSLIKQVALREENVLFIDDNLHNLKEVLHFCPKINVCTPDYIGNLLKNPNLKGKDDSNKTRLKQYKNLEKKLEDFSKSNLSNIEFLKQSNIQVKIHNDCIVHIDRIHELVLRTNQLNYTKNRLSKEELLDEINNPISKCGYLTVKDRYGDYGISGFYLIKNGKLEHFLFSCRTMNMFIETWLYNKLDKPILEVKGEVAYQIDSSFNVDFINSESPKIDVLKLQLDNYKNNQKTLLVGGCDLGQVVFYLNNKSIDTDFNYVIENINVHKDHTLLIKQFLNPSTSIIKLIEKLPVLSVNDINLKIFNTNWDTLIFSPLNDYSRGLYKHKETGFILPFDSFNIDWTKPFNQAMELPHHLKYIPKDFFNLLTNEFEFLGPISPVEFSKNIKWLLNKFKNKNFIFLNGSEFPLKSRNYWEDNMHKRHKEMNKVLEQIMNLNENVRIIDVNNFCNDENDFLDNLRHYNKLVYRKIATVIVQMLNEIDEMNETIINSEIKVLVKKIYSKIRSKLLKGKK